jgi:peptide chain release factor 2
MSGFTLDGADTIIKNIKDKLATFEKMHSELSTQLEELDVKVAHFYSTGTPDNNNIDIVKEHVSVSDKLRDTKNTIDLCQYTIEYIEYMVTTNDYTDDDLMWATVEAPTAIERMYNKYTIYSKFTEEDKLSCIVSIVAGSGGTEAEDWTGMLFRMYLRWCDMNSYKVEITRELHSMEANNGYKKVTFIVEGTNAYGFLKNEAGVHRLIRKSPFDSSGRRHTSFSSVKVTPIVDETIEINVDKSDVRVDTLRGQGAGGQHRNKTESAVRLTHIPSGITAFCQSDRSQHRNKENAWKVLMSRLYEHAKSFLEKPEEEKVENAFGSQIRTYWFHPTQKVKDHRSNYSESNFNSVLDGNIQDFIISNI